MTTINALDEQFTLWLGQDGQPVQKRLSEMTVGEVLQALHWSDEEGERLQRETANLPAKKLHDALQRGEITIDDLSDIQIEELRRDGELLRRAGEHFLKRARLMDMARASMPQWHRNTGMLLKTALGRYWPR